MELWLWAVVGGLVGTVLMDITASLANALRIRWGGCGGNAAIGRWVLGLLAGRFVHKNIIESSPLRHERSAGWVFHYFTGASVALTYPYFFLAFSLPLPENHLNSGLLWGLATTLLPWFILFPGFGWGLFGVRAPGNVRPLVSPAVSHMLYGLGLGIVLNIASPQVAF